MHSRKRDQNWNNQEACANSPACKGERGEERSRRGGVAGWKGIISRIKFWPVPFGCGLDAWASASGRNFDHARRHPSQRAGDDHRRENALPPFATAPIRDPEQHQPKNNMLGPVAVFAHGLHETAKPGELMLFHPGVRPRVPIEAGEQEKRGPGEDQKPPQSADPSKFPFVFHPALSLNLGSATRNPQFHPRFPRRAPSARRRDLDDPARRPGRAPFRRGFP